MCEMNFARLLSNYELRHREFSASARLLQNNEPRLCERSEAISFFMRGVLRLLHCVRNDEIRALPCYRLRANGSQGCSG